MVVDASVALSFILPGEGAVLCLSLRDSAAANPEIRLFVPPNFWYRLHRQINTKGRRTRKKKSHGSIARTLGYLSTQ